MVSGVKLSDGSALMDFDAGTSLQSISEMRLHESLRSRRTRLRVSQEESADLCEPGSLHGRGVNLPRSMVAMVVSNHLFLYGSFLCDRRSKNQSDRRPVSGTV